jgi:hypothetical protein
MPPASLIDIGSRLMYIYIGSVKTCLVLRVPHTEIMDEIRAEIEADTRRRGRFKEGGYTGSDRIAIEGLAYPGGADGRRNFLP